MLGPWAQDIFKSIESGTCLRLIILLALMICVVWITFRTERRCSTQRACSGNLLHARARGPK